MRKNKKLLLASVAAMGALALGVGATSTFAWFTATQNAATQEPGATGSIGVSNVTLDNDSLYIVPTLTLAASEETGATSENTVVYTDSEGQVFAAVENNEVYKAALASRPATVGTYLKVTVSFVAYLTRTNNGTPQAPDYAYSNPLTAADAGVKAARNGETHHYTLDMTGRGKIGDTIAHMYEANFNSTGSQVTAESSPAATGPIAGNTVSKTASQLLTIAADGSIANSSTFYVGIDGSQYSCNVSVGDVCYNEGAYAVGTNQGATTTVAIAWVD